MQIKIRAFDGNLERKVIKVIRVKLLIKICQSYWKLQVNSNNIYFIKMDQIDIKRQYGSNRIALWWKFIKKHCKEKEKSCSGNLIENPWEDRMIQMVLYLDMSLLDVLSNATQIEPNMLLIKNDQIFLNGQYGSTHIVGDWYLPVIF